MEIRKFAQDKLLPPSAQAPQQTPSVQAQAQTKGVMTPMKLNETSVSILTERIKDEYGAHYFYRSAANWCRGVNYKKAAEFFEAEANSELEHAKKLQEYLDDWNHKPVIGQTETNYEFNSLVDIINGAYKMEFGLLESYNKSSSQLFTEDLTTFDFLQEFRNLQKSAVIEYSDLLNALVLVDSTDKFQLLYFEQTYF
jgi:ferritin